MVNDGCVPNVVLEKIGDEKRQFSAAYCSSEIADIHTKFGVRALADSTVTLTNTRDRSPKGGENRFFRALQITAAIARGVLRPLRGYIRRPDLQTKPRQVLGGKVFKKCKKSRWAGRNLTDNHQTWCRHS